jgi:hypothetical protein
LVRKVHVSGRRSLAIVNTVERAQKLYAALVKAGVAESQLVLVHSRFRPGDRSTQMARLQVAEDRIVIATQAIEAGVDLRGINAAASLKRDDRGDGRDADPVFRGINAAASLKPPVFTRPHTAFRPFSAASTPRPH